MESLRLAFFGGEPLKYSLARRFNSCAPDVTVVNCYGATETPQVAACYVVEPEELSSEPNDSKGRDAVPIGRGIDGIDLHIHDGDGLVCKPGEEGEIWIHSPYLARQVWNGDGSLAPVFRPSPGANDPRCLAYPTGDYGFQLPDGNIVLTHRRDKQVKIRGHRIQLEEIERLLATLPGLSAYHVDAQTDTGAGPSLVVYAVSDTDRGGYGEAVQRLLAENLPEYMVPDRLVFVPALPITPNGKVDVEELRSSAARSGPKGPILNVPLGDELDALLDVCKKELGVPWLSADDELMAAGLNSLTSVVLLCAIEERLGIELSVQDLTAGSTCRRIADHIVFLRSILGQGQAVYQGRAGASPEVGSLMDGPGSSPIAAGAPIVVGPRLIPRNENVAVGVRNRVLQLVARVAPDTLRVKCHKWRGVSLGRNVSIGYDTILETAYPWLIKIGDQVNVGMRVTIIGHFRGMASVARGSYTVEIGDLAFIGPGVIILPNVKIGEGAVVTAGSVVNASIPALVVAHGNPARPVARCGVPLSGTTTYSEFLRQLRPL
jgi:acetyltransferase-like isoleucine patch superfamily enzyme/acyl carrier protein